MKFSLREKSYSLSLCIFVQDESLHHLNDFIFDFYIVWKLEHAHLAEYFEEN